MYWGLVLKTNKRYSQQISKGFHVSNATLDLNSIEKDAVLSVWVHTDDSDHLLCNLNEQIPQVPLDLVFSEGETVAFYSKGNGTIHLNGNVIQDDDFGMDQMGGDEELDEEIEDEDIDYAVMKKVLKKEKLAKTGKKLSEAEKEDEIETEKDSEDESDDDVDELEDEEDSDEDDDLDDDEDDMSDDEDKDEDDDGEEEEELISAPPPKKGKMESKQNGVTANGKPAQKNEREKKSSKTEKKEQKTGKKTLVGGVIIEDLHPGKGPEATAGKRVTVYYIGRLQKTNKIFDSTQSGEGFKFHLGKNEVIRGWDVGVVGMRVGGKRRIICPPHTAYGAKGAPPAIPGNATLVFDVTLRAMN